MATITEDYVSFEIAKLLKEKGFDASCNRYYNAQYDSIRTVSDTFLMNWNDEKHMKSILMEGAISIPSLQMAIKWLREVHKLYVNIYIVKNYSNKTVEYCITIEDLNFPSSDDGFDIRPSHESYEEAAEAAIKYCLKNLI